MADIFLSYAREDIEKAKLLANALENQGWSVFWDRTSLLAGQDFEEVIEQEIIHASCMVVAWSKAANQSDWVRGEASMGRTRNILVPILFEPVDPPIAFRSLHTESFFDWNGETGTSDFLKLCKAISRCINPKITDVPFTKTGNTFSVNATTVVKTHSFKHVISKIWEWLSITNNKKTFAFISSGIIVLISWSWQGYLHFSGQLKEPKPTFLATDNRIVSSGNINATTTNGGNSIVATGNVTVGISPEKIKEIINTLTSKHQLDSKLKDQQIKDLTETVTALSKGIGVLGTEAQINSALDTLAKGDTSQAKALFTKAAQAGTQETKQKAKAFRNLGSLALLDNTQEAINAYISAAELDPENVGGSEDFKQQENLSANSVSNKSLKNHKNASFSLLEIVHRFVGVSGTPSLMSGGSNSSGPKYGNIWVANLTTKGLRQVTKGGGYSSPVFQPGGQYILALKENDVLQIAIANGYVVKLLTIPGVEKIVGFRNDDPDKALILLKEYKIIQLSIKTGEIVDLEYDKNSEEAEQMVTYLWNWRRDYGSTNIDVKSAKGYSTNVYLQDQGENPETVSNCDQNADCGQPSLSNDGQQVVFIKIKKSPICEVSVVPSTYCGSQRAVIVKCSGRPPELKCIR